MAYGKKTQRMTILLTESGHNNLRTYAARMDMSAGEVVRAALNNFIAQNPPPQQESLELANAAGPQPTGDAAA